MKLGELKGEQAIEVIADLIEPVANIARDQQNLQLFRAEKKTGESDRDMAVRDLTQKIPVLLKTHKKDVLSILHAVNGTDPDEMSVIDIIKGALELVSDQDFLSLFMSAVSHGERKQPTESSADAELSEPES